MAFRWEWATSRPCHRPVFRRGAPGSAGGAARPEERSGGGCRRDDERAGHERRDTRRSEARRKSSKAPDQELGRLRGRDEAPRLVGEAYGVARAQVETVERGGTGR